MTSFAEALTAYLVVVPMVFVGALLFRLWDLVLRDVLVNADARIYRVFGFCVVLHTGLFSLTLAGATVGLQQVTYPPSFTLLAFNAWGVLAASTLSTGAYYQYHEVKGRNVGDPS